MSAFGFSSIGGAFSKGPGIDRVGIRALFEGTSSSGVVIDNQSDTNPYQLISYGGLGIASNYTTSSANTWPDYLETKAARMYVVSGFVMPTAGTQNGLYLCGREGAAGYGPFRIVGAAAGLTVQMRTLDSTPTATDVTTAFTLPIIGGGYYEIALLIDRSNDIKTMWYKVTAQGSGDTLINWTSVTGGAWGGGGTGPFIYHGTLYPMQIGANNALSPWTGAILYFGASHTVLTATAMKELIDGDLTDANIKALFPVTASRFWNFFSGSSATAINTLGLGVETYAVASATAWVRVSAGPQMTLRRGSIDGSGGVGFSFGNAGAGISPCLTSPVQLGSIVSSMSGWTVMAAIKYGGTPTNTKLIAGCWKSGAASNAQRGVGFLINNGGTELNAYSYTPAGAQTQNMDPDDNERRGQWHLYAIVCAADTGYLTYYRIAMDETTVTTVGADNVDSRNLYVPTGDGYDNIVQVGDPSAGTWEAYGDVSYFAVYNVPKSEADILAIKNYIKPRVTGTEIYVNGSSVIAASGNGSANAPYKTLTQGIQNRASRDVINLAAGTYTETINTGAVATKPSCTETFILRGTGNPVIKSPGTQYAYCLFIDEGASWDISGVTLDASWDGTTNSGTGAEYALFCQMEETTLTLDTVTAKNAETVNALGHVGSGIMTRARYNYFTNLTTHNNEEHGLYVRIEVGGAVDHVLELEGLVSHSNSGRGLQLSNEGDETHAATNFILGYANNLNLYSNGHGMAIAGMKDFTITNTLIHDCTLYGLQVGWNGVVATENVGIYNVTVEDCALGFLDYSNATGITVYNGVFSGNDDDYQQNAGTTTFVSCVGDSVGDPLPAGTNVDPAATIAFVAADDWHLDPTSAGAVTGTNFYATIPALRTDLAGDAREQSGPWDMGPYGPTA